MSLEERAERLARSVWETFKREFKRGPRNVTFIELLALCRRFLKECEERGIDPEAIDFYAEVFEDAEYEKLERKLERLLDAISPRPMEPTEIGLREAINLLESMGYALRKEELRKVEEVLELERKLAKVSRELEELRRRLEEEKRRREELERARAPPPPPPPPPPAPPRRLTPEEEKKLEDLFKSTLFRELGRVPRAAMTEFRIEMEALRGVSYEEAAKAIERLAKELAEKFKGAPPELPPAPVSPPWAYYGPRTIEEVWRDVVERWGDTQESREAFRRWLKSIGKKEEEE